MALALPALECHDAGLRSSEPARLRAACCVIVNNIGVLAKHVLSGRDGQRLRSSSPYLMALAAHRADFTVFSGLSHPGVTGGHSTDNSFLTSARGAFKASFRNTISLDQLRRRADRPG
jgi:hypothetical protein